MMKDLDYYKSEIFRRGKEKMAQRARLKKTVIGVSVPALAVIVIAVSGIIPRLGDIAANKTGTPTKEEYALADMEDAIGNEGDRYAFVSVRCGEDSETNTITDPDTVAEIYSLLTVSSGDERNSPGSLPNTEKSDGGIKNNSSVIVTEPESADGLGMSTERESETEAHVESYELVFQSGAKEEKFILKKGILTYPDGSEAEISDSLYEKLVGLLSR